MNTAFTLLSSIAVAQYLSPYYFDYQGTISGTAVGQNETIAALQANINATESSRTLSTNTTIAKGAEGSNARVAGMSGQASALNGDTQNNSTSAGQQQKPEPTVPYNPMTVEQCGAMSESLGIIPLVDWGTATDDQRLQFMGGLCFSQICYYWQDKYNINNGKKLKLVPQNVLYSYNLPEIGCDTIIGANFSPHSKCSDIYQNFESATSFPDMVQFVYGQKNCDTELATLSQKDAGSKLLSFADPKRCGNLSESVGLLPPDVVGNANDQQFNEWATGMCNTQICYYWRDKYNIIIGQTWGTAPQSVISVFGNSDVGCTSVILNNFGPQSTCSDLYFQFNKTWPSWIASYFSYNCKTEVCQNWSKQYNIVKGVSWGTADASIKKAWTIAKCSYVEF